jgi:hypothetical protein
MDGNRARMNKAVLFTVPAILLGGVIGVMYSWWGVSAQPAAAPAPVDRSAASGTSPSTAFEAAPASNSVSPVALAESDEPLRAAAVNLIGQDATDIFLFTENVVRHVVATVDTLPRHHFAASASPLKPLDGGFIATSDDQKSPLSANNFARYTPYVAILQRLDIKRFAQLYHSHQGLFQQAYEELTHTQDSFDTRLHQAIDDLLAVPTLSSPPLISRPNAFYEFADPELERLSSGQKLLLRMGPQNAGVIKAKLVELRGALNTH